MPKKTIMYQVACTVELDEDALQEGGKCDTAERKLHDRLRFQTTVDGDLQLTWESSSMQVQDPEKMNCGRCTRCGSWVSDCEKENRIEGLSQGATVDGELLCNEHLPRGHRWAF